MNPGKEDMFSPFYYVLIKVIGGGFCVVGGIVFAWSVVRMIGARSLISDDSLIIAGAGFVTAFLGFLLIIARDKNDDYGS